MDCDLVTCEAIFWEWYIKFPIKYSHGVVLCFAVVFQKFCGFLWDITFSIPTWTSNHMPSKVWDEITDPFSNFNGCTVEVWEWLSNFIQHYNGCNYLSMLWFKLIYVSKRYQTITHLEPYVYFLGCNFCSISQHFDALVQNCSISSALAMKILHSLAVSHRYVGTVSEMAKQ